MFYLCHLINELSWPGRPLDTAYPPVGYDVSNLLPRQRIDCCSLNNVSCSSKQYDVFCKLNTKRCITKSSTKELFTPLENPERVFRSKRRLFKTPGLVESSLPEFDLFSDIEERSEEETTEIMMETMEQYMSKTWQFLKELCENTFSGSEHEDANEHIKKVLEIVDLFHIPGVTQDQIMLRAFPMSLTGAASRWLRNEPSGSITNWEIVKTKFLNKFCPPARTTKKMEEINNFQQEPDESLFRAWERFKGILDEMPPALFD
ncbi:retrovirus-related pol polyprotein from transposon TNT 1-94 [Tanacetum coccineum]